MTRADVTPGTMLALPVQGPADLPRGHSQDETMPFRFIGLLRMKRWAANPPSEKMVRLVLGIILLCALVFAVERLVGWPDWLTPNHVPRGRF